MADVTASDRIFNLVTSNDELIGSLDWVTDAAWTRRPADGEWSAAEIVGHVIELEPYWARQASILAENPGAEVGRTLDDPGRLAGPAAGPAVSPREAKMRLAQAGEQAAEMLRKIPDSAWSTRGRWRDRDLSLSELIEEHLTNHVRAHIDQLTAALGG